MGFGNELQKLNVWSKGRPIPGYDPAVWRYDDFGTPMRFADYGNRNAEHGWEIDHAQPSALGGSNALGNLRPLHHRNNSGLGGILSALMATSR